jgi:predicted PurR-regulated permease PerM
LFALQVTLLFVNGIVAFIFAFIPYMGELLSVILPDEKAGLFASQLHLTL